MNRRHARPAGPRSRTRVVVSAGLTAAAAAAAVTAAVVLGAAPSSHPGAPEPDPVVDAAPAAATAAPEPSPTVPTPPAPLPDVELTIIAAGDVLPHLPVLSSARSGGGYDFSTVLAGLDPWVAGADLALCHFEVPVAPAGTKPSGYPAFGTVAALVDDLAAQGWDGCSTASNHSVDRGFDGVVATLDAFDAAGLGHVGTARDEREAQAPQLYALERDGQQVVVAQLAATYGTNGLPVPAAAPWSVELIDAARLVDQARAARTAGADLVVVSVHAGTEYRTDPTPEQVALASELASSGAIDLYIGHHAHVPQPIQLLPGGPSGDGMWVAYGLGNMLSNQDSDCCVAATASGLLLTAHVVKPAEGAARVASVEWTATSVDRRAGHRLHLLHDAVSSDAQVGTLGQAQWQARYDGVRAAVGDQAAERTTAPVPTGERARVLPRAVTD